MKKIILIIIALAAVTAAYIGFKFYGVKQAPTSMPESTTITAPKTETIVVAPKTWTVEYKENQFVPRELKIKKGDIVTWINNNSEPIWPASAIHPTHQVYPGFDALKGLNTGESYSFTFDKVGNWKYHNHLNPSVTGVVEVSD
ncbi:MAG: hypothetical protein UV48_C0012G0005 [Candidatus Azambacteria bacterium GW2011_GWA2_42_9]|uniref:Plastocyanin n=3 Tax=Candidatus Azamiibacteriota TaxID=1752741 RepID=A0A0G1C7Q1_9BACT|nr:MAG: hypothetical protein UV07_C0012G0005 [Candidatus Azambacteria bacterium GW2011_GWB1_42_17]KKS45643.1 MAG: hypothetical protein UV10_C0017G0009 [Candidatus Azambacteria bacterium GW2011_GWA1_42_19]KKS75433.1 MAG: hypothetical protein UV48_C0012G0005 [Candidatus Azambacteria bacterium GW2011_GWA2_42_9]KKS88084.1 MAG: hypothetical protein UV62_C0015G0005 [Parcubacteria group bacterium GW2011_GWC1_43_11]